jgi:hypothetical protein
MRAAQREWEAKLGKEAIEDKLRHELNTVEEAHCASGNVVYRNQNRWKIDAERLMAEEPLIGARYKKNQPGRLLRISR